MRTFLFLLMMVVSAISFAHPANDNPCAAIDIPVIENADSCTPQSFNITNAAYLNLMVPNAFGNTNPDTWYSFIITCII